MSGIFFAVILALVAINAADVSPSFGNGGPSCIVFAEDGSTTVDLSNLAAGPITAEFDNETVYFAMCGSTGLDYVDPRCDSTSSVCTIENGAGYNYGTWGDALFTATLSYVELTFGPGGICGAAGDKRFKTVLQLNCDQTIANIAVTSIDFTTECDLTIVAFSSLVCPAFNGQPEPMPRVVRVNMSFFFFIILGLGCVASCCICICVAKRKRCARSCQNKNKPHVSFQPLQNQVEMTSIPQMQFNQQQMPFAPQGYYVMQQQAPVFPPQQQVQQQEMSDEMFARKLQAELNSQV
jgi:hypothetical protein